MIFSAYLSRYRILIINIQYRVSNEALYTYVTTRHLNGDKTVVNNVFYNASEEGKNEQWA